jgi:hypothetical protein
MRTLPQVVSFAFLAESSATRKLVPNVDLGSVALPPLREPSSALSPLQAEPTHFAPPRNPATNFYNPGRFRASSLAGPQGIDTGSMDEISSRRRLPKGISIMAPMVPRYNPDQPAKARAGPGRQSRPIIVRIPPSGDGFASLPQAVLRRRWCIPRGSHPHGCAIPHHHP